MGVNQFRSDSEERYEPLRVNPLIEAEQRERLRRLRAERDNAAVDQALKDLHDAARVRTTSCSR